MLSGSLERVFEEVLKPLLLEARRLRTTARRMGKSHVPAPWTAQRVRRPLPYDGDLPPKPLNRIRWGPVLCPPPVSVVNSDLDFADSDSPALKRARRQHQPSLPRSQQAHTLLRVRHHPVDHTLATTYVMLHEFTWFLLA